ncbi:MAG: short-chain dehydrogenase, partial [Rhizobiales bacterium]|nr:short-chain dehydrogenase [Hyphomicrobiales bacterium]
VSGLKEPIDALIMNAGGMGGKTPASLTTDGVTQIFATNVLGHVVLVDELIKANKLKNIALFAGSEAARGIKKMGMKQPNLNTSSVDEFSSIMDGSYFNNNMNTIEAYGLTKYIAALWMSSQARKNPNIRFITMSPGGTQGTAVMDDMPAIQNIMFKYIMMPFILPLMGMAHSLETGAKRFVDGISNSALKSGVFYGSKKNVITGVIVDQSEFFDDLNNVEYQNNAAAAIHKFI